MGSSMGKSQGVFGFWVKPGFLPEMAGKPRQFLTADRHHSGFDWPSAPMISPFCLWFVASHDALSYQPCLSEGATPIYNLGNPFGTAPIRSSSLTFGYGYSGASGFGGNCIAEGGCVSPTLNHESHPDAASRVSYLRGHRWTHIACSWDTKDQDRCKIFINGKLLPGTVPAFFASYDPDTSVPWFTHEDGSQNCVRIGATSAFTREGVKKYQRNWPADATIDEFYWWNSFGQVSSAMEIARLGRFYNPCHGNEEATFTSQEINLLSTRRTLAPPTSIATPGGGPISTTMAAPPNQVRLLSAQWTLYGEFVDPKGPGIKEMIHDHHPSDEGVAHPVTVEFSIVDGTTVYGPWKDLASCRLVDPAGNPLVLSNSFRYKVRFVIDGLRTDSELRSTPIVDDITILYRSRSPQFVSYCLEN
jgi:hypothetical protein